MYSKGKIIRYKILITVLTDLKSLFRVTVGSETRTERKLMVNVKAILKPFENNEI